MQGVPFEKIECSLILLFLKVMLKHSLQTEENVQQCGRDMSWQ